MFPGFPRPRWYWQFDGTVWVGLTVQIMALVLYAALLLSSPEITAAQPTPIRIVPDTQADPSVVANWTAALVDAPIAREQGTYPLKPLDVFPGVVVVPGRGDTRFATMTVSQVGWTTDLMSDGQPRYAVDLTSGQESAQWLGSMSHAFYEYHASGQDGVLTCRLTAGYCSSEDAQGVLAQEVFGMAVEGWTDPVIVEHWGNYLGHFEFWAADWYVADLDMSYRLLLSGAALGVPALTFDERANTSAAQAVAKVATSFTPWTP